MAAEENNGWKTFGIISIVVLIAAAIALAAFLLGRGCEEEEEKDSTGTTQTQPEASPPPEESITPDQPDGAAGPEPLDPGGTEPPPDTPTDTEPAEPYITGEGEGSTPCAGGFMTTTRTTYWSDGSTDTTVTTEPCP